MRRWRDAREWIALVDAAGQLRRVDGASAESEIGEITQTAMRVLRRVSNCDGFNIGINAGAAAGQTVFHLHIHVIPRYHGDVVDPRGGVRHVIPAKANYLRDVAAPHPSLRNAPHYGSLIRGHPDPLLPHLKVHIDHDVLHAHGGRGPHASGTR